MLKLIQISNQLLIWKTMKKYNIIKTVIIVLYKIIIVFVQKSLWIDMNFIKYVNVKT